MAFTPADRPGDADPRGDTLPGNPDPSGERMRAGDRHGLAPEPQVARWQHRLDPFWTRVSCHLDRPMDALIAEAGFAIADLKTGYLDQGPKLATFMYMGRAVPSLEVA